MAKQHAVDRIVGDHQQGVVGAQPIGSACKRRPRAVEDGQLAEARRLPGVLSLEAL